MADAKFQNDSSSDSSDDGAEGTGIAEGVDKTLVLYKEMKRHQFETRKGENELKLQKIELKKKSLELIPYEDDFAFFISLLPYATRLDSKEKMEFRLKVQQLLFDMTFSKAKEPNITSPPKNGSKINQ